MKSTAKNKKVLSILAIALVLCIVAGFGIYQILAPTRATVYLFNNDYAAGTQVTQSMLTPVAVDSKIVEGSQSISTGEYFITAADYSAVLQSAGILRTDVHQGSALMKSMVTTTGGNSIEMTMKRNAVAITVGVTPVSGVTNELAAGSRVNVYASYDGQTTLPLQNIRVLSVGRSDGVISRVTLEVDVSQSMKLVHAYTYGTVHLGLVDATGYQYTSNDTPAYTVSGFSVDANTQNPTTQSESQPETVIDNAQPAAEDNAVTGSDGAVITDSSVVTDGTDTTGSRLN